jgi:iron complex outermembrane receptor protein
VQRNEDSSEGSGRIVLDARISENAMAYVGYSRGYRAGTYNGLAYRISTRSTTLHLKSSMLTR